MSRSHALLAVTVCSILACGATPPPGTVSKEAKPAGPSLRRMGEDLFVVGLNQQYARGTILYVESPEPVPGSINHPRIGLVQVTEPASMKVAWYCVPKQPIDGQLMAQGVPVSLFTPDTTLRVSKCWGRYTGQSLTNWPSNGVVDLPINLVTGDHVKPDDRYEILGHPHNDLENRAVTGFERLGTCRIMPFSQDVFQSICRLDTYTAPKFNPQWWVRGGFARLVQPEVP